MSNNPTVDELKSQLREYQRTSHKSIADGIRVQFAGVINGTMNARGWTPAQLSEASGVPESAIPEILHGDGTCTTDTFARLLFALGVDVKIGVVTPAWLTEQEERKISEASDTSATVERARHIASIARDAKHFAYADEFDLLAEAIDALTAERDRLRELVEQVAAESTHPDREGPGCWWCYDCGGHHEEGCPIRSLSKNALPTNDTRKEDDE